MIQKSYDREIYVNSHDYTHFQCENNVFCIKLCAVMGDKSDKPKII